MKKKILKLGSIGSIAIPLITVLSCGFEDAKEEDIITRNKLESSTILNKIEEDWWKFIIKDEKIQDFNSNDLLASTEIKKNFEYLLQNKIYKDSSYLYTLALKISKLKSFDDLLKKDGGKSVEVKLEEWGFYKVELSEKITDNYKNALSSLNLDAKKFIVKNDLEFRKELYKFTIAKRFLKNDIQKEEYKNIYLKKEEGFTNMQNLFNASEFNILNETMKQKLFLNWNIELSEFDSINYFGPKSDIEKTYDELKALIVTNGSLLSKQPNLFLDKKVLLENMLDTDEYNEYKKIGGYTGIQKQSSINSGLLNFNIAWMKEAEHKSLWEGFVFEDKFVNNLQNAKEKNKIKMTIIPKDQKKAKVKFIKGLMPIYKDNKLTFDDSDFATANKLNYLINALSIDSSVYENAIIYYTKRKKNPILLKVADPLKTIAIRFGFGFIKK